MNLEQLKERIAKEKETLETLPENTISNKEKKKEYIENTKKDLDSLEENLFNEITKRYMLLNEIRENESIALLKQEEEKLTLFKKWNEYNTTYEKMHLDYYLYQLHRYYKEDLKSVNLCISTLLESFKTVGVTLTPNDFYFHPLAKEYINTIINNSENEEHIHKSFEDIYWKCTNIVRIIEMNFKSLYYKNSKKIEKYYQDNKKQIMEHYNEQEIYDAYCNTVNKRLTLESIDIYNILQKFLSKEITLLDITPENIEKKKNRLFKVEVEDKISILNKLKISIIEYEKYQKYQYIIQDMKERLKEKEKYKGTLEAKLKEIEKLEKELLNYNVKKEKALNSKSIFARFRKQKRDEQLTFTIQSTLEKIEILYKELDDIKYNDLISEKLTSDTNISETLKMASSNYLYFVKLTKILDENKNIKEITEEFQEFVAFTNSFSFAISFTILNNIYLLEEKNIAEVISDRYKLSSVAIEKEDFNPDSLVEIKKAVNDIILNDDFARTLLKKEDVEFYLEMKKSGLFEC